MPKPNMTLENAIQSYLQHLGQTGKSSRTLYTYGKDFEQILDFFSDERPLNTISLPQVGKFLKSDALLMLPNGKARAEQTVQKTVRVLRMFLFWCREQGWIDVVPLPKSTPLGRQAQLTQKSA